MRKTISQWELHDANFEFTKELPAESSAWSGHYDFAYDLVANTKPSKIVELGTHRGNSLFSFAQAVKDLKLDTELHPIDTWEGDEHAGYYGEEIYQEFTEIIEKYYSDLGITPHRMFFDDALEKFEDNSIDILHIDGLHTYEAVKHDFEMWLPKVKNKTGIILLHDVCEKSDDFGVYKLWEELKERYKTITFEHYHGLGVIFLQEIFFEEKYIHVGMPLKDYQQLYEFKNFIHESPPPNPLELLEESNQLKEENRILKEKTAKLLSKERELTYALAREGKRNQSLAKRVEEFEAFKKGVFWRVISFLRRIKKTIRGLFQKNLGK
jgi:predicted O-methyltransferase YrrM